MFKRMFYQVALRYAQWRVQKYLAKNSEMPDFEYEIRYITEGPNRCITFEHGKAPVVMIRETPISVKSMFLNRVICAHRFTSTVDRFSFALLHEIRHAYQQHYQVLTYTVFQEPRDGSLFVYLKWRDDFHLMRQISSDGEIQILTEHRVSLGSGR